MVARVKNAVLNFHKVAEAITAKAGSFPASSSPSLRLPGLANITSQVRTIGGQFYVAKGAARGEIIADAQIWCDYLC